MTEGKSLSRRSFLALGGTATAAVVAAIAGYRAIFDANPVEASVLEASASEASQSDEQLATSQEERGVACPQGLVDDPYPGRCRHYRDSNGDGICDYSVSGSGSNR